VKQNYFILFLLTAVLCACGGAGGQTEIPGYEPGTLTVMFDYTKQSGFGSNQFAVWIEDASGNFIKTLYATKFTADGGYARRPDSLSIWTDKSGLFNAGTADAAAGATPKAGPVFYVWDLTDANGNAVENGTYYYKVEGSIRGKNRTLHTGEVVVGTAPSASDATVELLLEESPGYPKLNEDAAENEMITGVKGIFTPR